MSKVLRALSIAGFAGVASAALAFPFSADFEADQSSSFTVTIANTPADANANFTYNSLSHVQSNGEQIAISKAPNSPTSTSAVLRLNANLGPDVTGDADTVSVYPTAGVLPSSWQMVFDCWQNYNGNAAGGTGSTNIMLFGATDATTVAPKSPATTSITGTGFWFTMTGEGGAAADYRFASGTGTITSNSLPLCSWFGAAPGLNMNHLDGVWSAVGTGFFQTPTFQTAGAPGKAWITVRMIVNGTNCSVGVKRPGDANYTTIATATVPAGSIKPFISFGDINLTLASPVADQFLLVDNLSITAAATAAEDWSMYQ